MAKKKGKKRKTGTQTAKNRKVVQQRRSGISRFGLLAIISLALALSLFFLLRNGDPGENDNDLDAGEHGEQPRPPVATLEMESDALIKVELDPVNAPNTTRNFIELAEAGFYDGLTFHRVIPGFMIQGGCPEGTGRGNPGYSIKGEFIANGYPNELIHERGVLSMARSPDYDSAGSQFFITVAETPSLDGEYAAFGRVLEGMEEVDRIVSVPTDEADKPLEEERIRSVTVELFGVEYDPPEKL